VVNRRQAENRLRENVLRAQVEAALGGHDLSPFEPVEEPGVFKYQAFCDLCGKSVYASGVALYSLLEDECPGLQKPDT